MNSSRVRSNIGAGRYDLPLLYIHNNQRNINEFVDKREKEGNKWQKLS